MTHVCPFPFVTRPRTSGTQKNSSRESIIPVVVKKTTESTLCAHSCTESQSLSHQDKERILKRSVQQEESHCLHHSQNLASFDFLLTRRAKYSVFEKKGRSLKFSHKKGQQPATSSFTFFFFFVFIVTCRLLASHLTYSP